MGCPMAQFEMDKLEIGEVCKMYGLNLEKILKELNGEKNSENVGDVIMTQIATIINGLGATKLCSSIRKFPLSSMKYYPLLLAFVQRAPLGAPSTRALKRK